MITRDLKGGTPVDFTTITSPSKGKDGSEYIEYIQPFLDSYNIDSFDPS